MELRMLKTTVVLKQSVELPSKLLFAYSCSEVVQKTAQILPGFGLPPKSISEIFTPENLIFSFLKLASTSLTMTAPVWHRIFSKPDADNVWHDWSKNTLKGIAVFGVQSLMGSLIRFSLPSSILLDLGLKMINSIVTAGLLDYLNDKKIPLATLAQLVSILIVKQSAGDIATTILELLPDIENDVLSTLVEWATEFSVQVLLPTMTGAITGLGINGTIELKARLSSQFSTFFHKSLNLHDDHSLNDERQLLLENAV